MINQPSTNPQIEILVVDTHALTHEFNAGKALRKSARGGIIPQPPTNATDSFVLGWKWQDEYEAGRNARRANTPWMECETSPKAQGWEYENGFIYGKDMRLAGQPLIMAVTEAQRAGWHFMEKCARSHWLQESAEICNHELTY